MMATRAEVRGLNEARQSLENIAEGLTGREMVQAMYQALNILGADAKRFSPVDTGRLRSSITGTVSKAGFPNPRLQGIVGTNVEYARFMEEGTGIFAGNSPVRMPPIEALEGWARRHKVNAWSVAYAIYRRGGLRARRMFAKSLERNQERVVQILGDKVRVIIQRS